MSNEHFKKTDKKYKYEESGLSNVFIEGLEIQDDDSGEECVMIPNIKGLHSGLHRYLLKMPGRMKGEQIRFIRTEMQLTCRELSTLTGIKVKNWKDIESDEKSLSRIEEACFRALAIEMLGLDYVCMEDLLGWCKGKCLKEIKIEALCLRDGRPCGVYALTNYK